VVKCNELQVLVPSYNSLERVVAAGTDRSPETIVVIRLGRDQFGDLGDLGSRPLVFRAALHVAGVKVASNSPVPPHLDSP
jgi:hypothetical protein